jgi:hypothetical protein
LICPQRATAKLQLACCMDWPAAWTVGQVAPESAAAAIAADAAAALNSTGSPTAPIAANVSPQIGCCVSCCHKLVTAKSAATVQVCAAKADAVAESNVSQVCVGQGSVQVVRTSSNTRGQP